MCQSIANGLVSASWIALVALGFGLIYGPARFFHFAHGVVFTLAPYLSFLFAVRLGLPVPISFLMAVGLSTATGCMMEIGVYRPLRHRGASPLTLLVASLGLYVMGQNTISLIFGKGSKTLGLGIHEGINVLGVRITPVQLVIVLVSLTAMGFSVLLIKKAKFGKAIRAVANDRVLATVSGIDGDRVILWSFAIGSALAAVAGILVALDVDMAPTMGLNAVVMGVVAFIIGGTSRIRGIALGALLVGMVQHVGVLVIGSQWQDAVVFIMLFAFLLVRPEGFLGRKIRKATV